MQVCADGLNYRDAPMGEIKHQAERGDVCGWGTRRRLGADRWR